MQWRQSLCSVCILTCRTPGKRSHLWDNSGTHPKTTAFFGQSSLIKRKYLSYTDSFEKVLPAHHISRKRDAALELCIESHIQKRLRQIRTNLWCKETPRDSCHTTRLTTFASASALAFEFLCGCRLFCWMRAGAVSLDELSLALSSPLLEMVPNVVSSVCIECHVSGTDMLLACKSIYLSNSMLRCNLLHNYTLH